MPRLPGRVSAAVLLPGGLLPADRVIQAAARAARCCPVLPCARGWWRCCCRPGAPRHPPRLARGAPPVMAFPARVLGVSPEGATSDSDFQSCCFHLPKCSMDYTRTQKNFQKRGQKARECPREGRLGRRAAACAGAPPGDTLRLPAERCCVHSVLQIIERRCRKRKPLAQGARVPKGQTGDRCQGGPRRSPGLPAECLSGSSLGQRAAWAQDGHGACTGLHTPPA